MFFTYLWLLLGRLDSLETLLQLAPVLLLLILLLLLVDEVQTGNGQVGVVQAGLAEQILGLLDQLRVDLVLLAGGVVVLGRQSEGGQLEGPGRVVAEGDQFGDLGDGGQGLALADQGQRTPLLLGASRRRGL